MKFIPLRTIPPTVILDKEEIEQLIALITVITPAEQQPALTAPLQNANILECEMGIGNQSDTFWVNQGNGERYGVSLDTFQKYIQQPAAFIQTHNELQAQAQAQPEAEAQAQAIAEAVEKGEANVEPIDFENKEEVKEALKNMTPEQPASEASESDPQEEGSVQGAGDGLEVGGRDLKANSDDDDEKIEKPDAPKTNYEGEDH